MTGRVLAALPLLFVVAGCVNEPRSQFLRPAGYTQTNLPPSGVPVQRDPKNEASEKRVLAVSHKVIETNPQAGLRPLFATFGADKPEIFHRGGGAQPWHVFISAGLVEKCKTDAQLAAVLCLELGKIVAERESMTSPGSRRGDWRLSPTETVGRDASGPIGSPDGTRFIEQARIESKQPPTGKDRRLPSPEVLAKTYLSRAGYDVRALTEVAPLLRQAEDNYSFEKQMRAADEQPRTAVMGRPIPAEKPTPAARPER
jgi:hypothetical protein